MNQAGMHSLRQGLSNRRFLWRKKTVGRVGFALTATGFEVWQGRHQCSHWKKCMDSRRHTIRHACSAYTSLGQYGYDRRTVKVKCL